MKIAKTNLLSGFKMNQKTSPNLSQKQKATKKEI